MKILWIVNTPLGPLGEAIYGKKANGAWMDALLDDFKSQPDNELIVTYTAKVKQNLKIQEDSITYYALPNNPPILYDENNRDNEKAWFELLKDERPDIIQVWGSEFTHGLCALRVSKKFGIPSVIYMQGYLGAIARHYFAGISYKEIKKNVTFRDILKNDSIIKQQKQYERRCVRELEMFNLSSNIISENAWCDMSIKAVVPNVNIYHCPLSINKVFFDKVWTLENSEQHSVICNASGYPLKGLHMMLEAVAILKQKYPNVKLYVPGEPQISDGSIKWRIRKRGYTKYIEKLIKKLQVQDNIVWLGRLSHEQLAEQYSKSNVFVLASAIENHSSSLKEAMAVGVPSVASAVGGVPEYVTHGENGFLYRFEEYEIMAGYIEKIFDDKELSVKLSTNAQSSMKKLHADIDMYRTTIDIYQDIIGNK